MSRRHARGFGGFGTACVAEPHTLRGLCLLKSGKAVRAWGGGRLSGCVGLSDKGLCHAHHADYAC